jgi:hypothetical protein
MQMPAAAKQCHHTGSAALAPPWSADTITVSTLQHLCLLICIQLVTRCRSVGVRLQQPLFCCAQPLVQPLLLLRQLV